MNPINFIVARQQFTVNCTAFKDETTKLSSCVIALGVELNVYIQ